MGGDIASGCQDLGTGVRLQHFSTSVQDLRRKQHECVIGCTALSVAMHQAESPSVLGSFLVCASGGRKFFFFLLIR